MYLDPSAIVIPSDNMVHIVARGGTVRVSGRDIHRLHARLEPLLHRAASIEDALSAIPATHVAPVRTYLSTLQQAHVLAQAPPAAGAAKTIAALTRRLGAGSPRLDVHDGSRCLLIALDGLPLVHAAGAAMRIAFATLSETLRMLVTHDLSRQPGHLIGVIVDDTDAPPRSEELDRRARIARWLLLNDADLPHRRDRLRLYRLSASGDLKQVAAVNQFGYPELREVLVGLGVLDYLDVEQAPLVALRLSVGSRVAAAIGLSYDAVASHLLRSLIVGATPDAGDGDPCAIHTGPVGGRLATYRPATVPRAVLGTLRAARSWLELRVQALERYARCGADEKGTVEWRTVDVLRERSDDGSVQYLQQVAGLRMPTLIASIRCTPAGLWQCRSGGIDTASFVRTKAIADLMLAAVWREFYARERPLDWASATASSYLDFTDEGRLRHVFSGLLEACRGDSPPPTMRVRAACRWGMPAWAGDIQESV